MSIRIYNNSVSAVARSFALAPIDGNNVVVWLELAPQHPKVLGAIWASLVNNTKEQLGVVDEANGDENRSFTVDGLHRRYIRLAADAPRIAARARPKFFRLIAPEATRIERPNDSFVVLAWPGMSAGIVLAAMLERGTSFPVRTGWGEYLLAEAQARGFAVPLVTGGPAPEGYVIHPAPWDEIISDGVRRGEIALEGGANITSKSTNAEVELEALCQPSASSLAL